MKRIREIAPFMLLIVMASIIGHEVIPHVHHTHSLLHDAIADSYDHHQHDHEHTDIRSSGEHGHNLLLDFLVNFHSHTNSSQEHDYYVSEKTHKYYTKTFNYFIVSVLSDCEINLTEVAKPYFGHDNFQINTSYQLSFSLRAPPILA